jgi:hypothetical protein
LSGWRHAGGHRTWPSGPIPAGCPSDRRGPDRRQINLSFGGVVHDPTDPVGRLLFNVLAMVAEFEADLIRLRTREGMKVAKAKGRVRGKPPKLNARQEARLVALHQAGEHSTAEIADLFGVGCSTVYRAIERHTQAAAHREESTDNDSLADRRPPHTHGRRRLSLLQGGRDGLRSASAARGAPHGTSVSFLRANRPSGLDTPPSVTARPSPLVRGTPNVSSARWSLPSASSTVGDGTTGRASARTAGRRDAAVITRSL